MGLKDHNTVNTVIKLVKHLKVPVTAGTINLELTKHPDQHSLLGISDVLNDLHVKNGAFQLSAQELDEVQCPFIAHLSLPKEGFSVVTSLTPEKVIFRNGSWLKHSLPRNKFNEAYQGTVLLAEAQTGSGDPEYQKNRRKEWLDEARLPFIAGLFTLIVFALLYRYFTFLPAFNLNIFTLGLLKTLGLVISVLLLSYSVNSNNPFVQKLCSGNTRDCNAILSSKAAKITEELNWSEVGFFYFASTWLVLLFYNGDAALINVLALLNLVSLPYTIWSVHYQYRVARRWCVLCCMVQAILWLEFFAFLPYLTFPVSSSIRSSWAGVSALILFPVALWVLVKSVIKHRQEISSLQHKLSVFKSNQELFNKVLTAQQHHDNPDERFAILLGERDAEQVLTIVSSPYCPPCSVTHQKVAKWLENRPDLQLRMVYSVQPDDPDKKKMAFVNHLISLSMENEQIVGEALHNWYGQERKDFEKWAAQFPVRQQATGHEKTLEKHAEWCKKAEIAFTPTIFINGYKLPDPYHLEDLKYMI